MAQPAGQRAIDAHERAQAPHALDHADGRDLARVGDGAHARRAQLLAAEPEHLDGGEAGAQRVQQIRPVQIAGRFAGDQQDAARGGDAQRLGRFAGVAHPTRAAWAARTSVSTLSRITCGDLERAQPVPSGDRRRLPRTDGLHEGVDLLLERVALVHLQVLEDQRGLARIVRLAADHANPALVEVDREVGVGLEDAQLALALERDPAGGHVGDAAVGEAQARVGDVDGRREHRDADRLHGPHRRRHHAEDDVEVVDHQVEDDVDVGAALGERRQAMALDEARLASPVRRARGSPG